MNFSLQFFLDYYKSGARVNVTYFGDIYLLYEGRRVWIWVHSKGVRVATAASKNLYNFYTAPFNKDINLTQIFEATPVFKE